MNSPKFSLDLQVAIDAAKAGGRIALKYFDTSIEAKYKKDLSIVTVADVETEDAIKKYIVNHFPTAKFVAEESGGDINEKDFWIIDPIDGTRVFAKGIPQWSILIAHYKNKEVLSGVCYIPAQNILIVAEKGKGAFLNGEQVHVSTTSSARGSFGSFGSIHRFEDSKPILRLNEKDIVLRSYEHAYALSFLAAGKMDVVIDAYGTPWDYAPFIRIIPEAGGKVTDFEGNEWNLDSKNLLATNGILHDEIVSILKS